ncbi:MAG: amidohydrolase [Bacillota bacterium]|nr:amidohydrolase [Bacillota bacterium]
MISAALIADKAQSLKGFCIETRRDFHRNPEVGMQEERTARLAAQHLEKLGLDIRTGVGGTGVSGVLQGARPGRTIAIRADMDALPIQDQKTCDYASRRAGVMHACGHDGHTAMLMATASLLTDLRDSLCGNVQFIFQPAEEGPGGARAMIDDGVLLDPKVDACLGLHLQTDLLVGRIGIRYGTISAASDSIEISIRGQAGPGAGPHEAVDAIAVAAQAIVALQTIVSREISPVEPAVVSVGTVRGGYRGNVIADEVFMTGTVRTLQADTRSMMPQRIERIIRGVTGAMRASYDLKYSFGYPSALNDTAITALAESAAKEILGQDQVEHLPAPTMGAEDFAYFAEAVPASFLRLGARNEAKGIIYPGHNPKFDFDEDAMPTGVSVLSLAAIKYLLER